MASCLWSSGPDPTFGGKATTLWSRPGIKAAIEPRTDDSTVFIYDSSNVLRAIARRDGRDVWQRVIASPAGNTQLESGSGVVVLATSALVALTGDAGTELWRASGIGAQHLTMCNGTLAVTTADTDGAVRFLDPVTGNTRWRTSILPIDSLVTLPAGVLYSGIRCTGRLVVAMYTIETGGLRSNGIAVLDAVTGVRQWARMLPTPLNYALGNAKVVAAGGGVIAVSTHEGAIHAFDEHTGAMRWTIEAERINGTVLFSGLRPIAIAGGNFVAYSIRHTIEVYDLNTGQLRGTVADILQPRSILNVRGTQFLVHQKFGGLTLVDALSGVVTWRLLASTPGEQINLMHLAGDTTFVTTANSGLLALRLP